MDNAHRDLVRDQFTRQAVPFASALAIRDSETLRRIVELSGAEASATVLDVGCGPGLLASAFALHVARVTGVDVTWAMLQQARAEQRGRGFLNIDWIQGDGTCLPCRDHAFSIVTSRLTFHHLLQPLLVLCEMARVCRRGGRVVVVDVCPAREKAAAFNRMETLRDPSHTRALPIDELAALFESAGLRDLCVHRWRMPGELESLLARSFPLPGNDAHVRDIFRGSIAKDAMDVTPRLQDGTIVYALPMALVSATAT
jgi:SAM-dependent methyltransferase